MKHTKNNNSKTVFVLFCVLLVCFLSIGAYARYAKTVIVSTVYQNEKNPVSTMGKETSVYDFGCYEYGGETQFDTTICIESDKAINGTLTFNLDSVSVEQSDIAVMVEGYSPDQNGNYTITDTKNVLNVPFSVVILATERVDKAHIDVTWTPSGAQKPTLSARYLITLNPYNETASKPQIIANKTSFLTNSLFALSAFGDTDLLVSRDGALFEKGTVYYCTAYPKGVTLVRDSLICLGVADDGTVDTVIKLNTPQTQDFSISIGTHPQNCAISTHTPPKDAAPIKADFNTKTAILKENESLELTVTEAAALVDDTWNDNAVTDAQLMWTLERFDGTKFVADTLNTSVDGKKIKISLQDASKSAGTYRISLLQTYNGYTIGHLNKVFFIDYR